jgi:hypothetical protein
MKINWYSDDQQQIDDNGQKTDALPDGTIFTKIPTRLW